MSENSMLPLVTVIIPCYNHEKYVETCLDSIFRQTYKNIEVILVDDCSSDNSVEVIQQLQKKYDFTFIEHKENCGLTKTLNDVIYNHAHGKYIKCIASDDYLTDDCVEVLTNEIEKLGDDYAMVYGKVKYFQYNKSGKINFGSEFGSKVESFQSLFMTNVIPAASALFSKQIFIDVGGYDSTLYIEDYYLWLIFAAQYKIGFINNVAAYYYLHNSGSMSSKDDLMIGSAFEIRSRIYLQNMDKLPLEYFFSVLKKRIGLYYFEDFNRNLKTNKFKSLKILLKNMNEINHLNKISIKQKLFITKCFLRIIIPFKVIAFFRKY